VCYVYLSLYIFIYFKSRSFCEFVLFVFTDPVCPLFIDPVQPSPDPLPWSWLWVGYYVQRMSRNLHPLGNAGSLKKQTDDNFEKLAPCLFKFV